MGGIGKTTLARWGEGLTDKLRLLKFDLRLVHPRPSFKISLINMNELAVLEHKGYVFPDNFHKTMGNLVKLQSAS